MLIGSLIALVLLLLLGAVSVFAPGARGMPTGRIWRVARIGRLFAGLSASWLGARVRRRFAGKAARVRIDETARRESAALVVRSMGQMKGAFMKLGQMASFVAKGLPPEVRATLASLQSDAPPLDFPLVRDVVERELGRPLERAFARFDERPLAAASIGQVHRALLPSGEEVVVKVQYPGVAEAIAADLANFTVLNRAVALLYPGFDPKPVADELRERLTEELDYVAEAKHQQTFGNVYEGHPFIRVPRVYPSHSTARVLTMEYVKGRCFAEVLEDPPELRARYGEILYRWVFGTIHQHRMFNGDPHPGNYLFDDAGRIVFLDYGCVKRFPEGMHGNWQQLVIAHLGGDREEFRRRAIALSFIAPDCDLSTDLLYEYFGYYYEPFRHDREFTFTHEYNVKSFRMVFSPDGPFAGMTKKMNMPKDFVLVNRIHWGAFAILCDLGATANYHRIQCEYLFGEAPSSELGRQDAAWREASVPRALAGAG